MTHLVERRQVRREELDQLAKDLRIAFPKDGLFYWIKAAKEVYELSASQAGYLVYATGLSDDRRR